jgi:sec-independent protein translocase protein TatB
VSSKTPPARPRPPALIFGGIGETISRQNGGRFVFGISMWEVVLILVVALIVLGPKQLTETARVLGRLYREIQKLATEVRSTVDFDAITGTDHHSSPPMYTPPPPPPPPATESSAAANSDIPVEPGRKSGPDFYADLLESSREEEKPAEEKAVKPVDAAKPESESSEASPTPDARKESGK